MKKLIKKTGLSVLGFLQGSIGNYIALLGLAFAFPQSTQGDKDYEEDMFFVPLGFFIMLLWLAVMITAFISLHKNKANLLTFFIAWLVGAGVFCFMLFL